MSGQKASSHGVFTNYHTALTGETLPEKLSEIGYQTHLVGKLHLWPERKRYGFHSSDWSDGPGFDTGDYVEFLRDRGIWTRDPAVGHGMSHNGWRARPWHLPDDLHFTNWCADSALRFLERRDPTVPFFLKVSFFQPHQPCTPPKYYFNHYMAQELPEPHVGDWARVFDEPHRGLPVDAWRVALSPGLMKQFRAGYYGSIHHIDDQIGRILKRVPEDTIILFLSDHGEMLGDHQWIRKRNAFEGSSHIPLIMNFPEEMDIEQGITRDDLVELMDVMPTVLDAVGGRIPSTVDGSSVMPLLRGENADWRSFLHGECCDIPTLNSGMQFMTDGEHKYVWFPGRGEELFFDLKNDPHELNDLSESGEHQKTIGQWRERLVDELKARPEGFVRNEQLTVMSGPTAKSIV